MRSKGDMQHEKFIASIIVLVVGVLFTAQLGQASPPAQGAPPIGDVSCDDLSNSIDSLFILQFNVRFLRTVSVL